MEQQIKQIYILSDTFFTDAYERIKRNRSDERAWFSLRWHGEYYRVYNPYVWAFLISTDVSLYGSDKTIDGTGFVQSYLEGLEAGELQFKENYPTTPNTLYGVNGDAIVNDLHRVCYHTPNSIFGGEGWIASATREPRDITYNGIKWYGFYGGLLTQYDLLSHNNAALFEKLVKCEYKQSVNFSNIQTTNNQIDKGKRGSYRNQRKDDVVRYFQMLVEDAVTSEIKNRKEPNEKKIISTAYNTLKNKQTTTGQPMYRERTLNDYLPATKRKQMFGEIRQRVSEQLKLLIK